MLVPKYTGIFVDNAEVLKYFKPKLSVMPGHMHVTLSYRGGIDSAHEEFLGETVVVRIVSYGNDSKNEALKVELEAPNPQLQKLCDVVKTPHITLSRSRDSEMRFSKELEFEPLEEVIELIGRYGVFTRVGLVLV